MPLSGKKILVLIADGFHDDEATVPVAFWADRGAEIVYTGLKTGTMTGKKGRETLKIEQRIRDIDTAEFDLLFIPGGTAPETLRLDDLVLERTREFMERPDKIVATICHGPQVLISAGVLAGRTLTCVRGIRDDVMYAGARYVDKKVCVDGRLVSSRVPDDMPAFQEAVRAALAPATASEGEAAPEEETVSEEAAATAE